MNKLFKIILFSSAFSLSICAQSDKQFTAYQVINEKSKQYISIIKNHHSAINNFYKKRIGAHSAVDSVVISKSDGNIYIHSYKYDSNGNVTLTLFSEEEKKINNYDENNYLISETYYLLNDFYWIVQERFLYSYDSDGNNVSCVHQLNIDDSLKNIGREKYVYRNNKLSEFLSQISLDLDTLWSNNYHELYDYNSDGTLNEFKEEFWSFDEDWNPTVKINYFYDTDNSLTSNICKEYKENTWVNSTQTNYSYTNDKKLAEELILYWNDSLWINGFKKIYTYSGDLLISEEWEEWKNSDWSKYSIYLKTYDVSSNLTEEVYESWRANQLLQRWRKKHDYDIENNIVRSSYEEYQSNNWIFTDGDLSFSDFWGNKFFFQEAVKLNVIYTDLPTSLVHNSNVVDFKLSQNYPNPFNPSTTINYGLPTSSKVLIKVYDILGSEIKTLVNKEQSAGNYKIEFNANNLPSGIYFYRIIVDKYSETKKMILLR